MLVQFSVRNFRSFDDEATLSMMASSDTAHPSHVVNVERFRRGPLLRGVAFYGANGSGKSNLLKAVKFAQNLIVNGTRPGQHIPVQPFRLRETAQPSRFQFHFIVDAYLFDYGFAVDAETVHEEWLFATPLEKGAKEQRWFERTTKNGKTEITFGNALTNRSSRQRMRLEFLGDDTRPEQLFISEIVDRNLSGELLPFSFVRNWFKETLLVLDAQAVSTNLPVITRQRDEVIQFTGDFLKKAGTGVESVITEEKEMDFENDLAGISKITLSEIRERCAVQDKKQTFMVRTPSGRRYIHCRPGFSPILVKLKMMHQSFDGALLPFDFEEISEGTQRLIDLMPILDSMLTKTDFVILLDELDRRLHTHLSRAFVQTALESENRRSQLIFTTHDTNLLDLDLLRRDEIWFVEKDRKGASNIYSLAEFKIRPDLQIEKGYLNGRFGAIPFIGDLSRIGLNTEKAA